MQKPSLDRVREILSLDVETGSLTWRKSLSPTARAGKRAGFLYRHAGYRYLEFDKAQYPEHVVIWFMLTGDWLPRSVDHINRDRADNRPSNLRAADESQQKMNTKIRADSTYGRGVYRHSCGRYAARVQIRGKVYSCGLYDTQEAAAAAARAKRLELFGEHAPAYDRMETLQWQ